jgi:hypothetical protein
MFNFNLISRDATINQKWGFLNLLSDNQIWTCSFQKASPNSPETEIFIEKVFSLLYRSLVSEPTKLPFRFQTNRYSAQTDFGCDLRIVLGLIQDHTGLLFCSNVFYEMVNLVNSSWEIELAERFLDKIRNFVGFLVEFCVKKKKLKFEVCNKNF